MDHSGRTGLRALVAAASVTTLLVGTAATATADARGDGSGLRPRTHFTMAADGSSGATEGGAGIPNIDSVKSTIRTYYNATNGIADKTSSPYISELGALTAHETPALVRTCAQAAKKGKKPAIVLDADDTTLWTYDMEDGAMKFNFDPALQDVWVQGEKFPATPSMVGLEKAIDAAGCTPVGLTDRSASQKDATLANLAKVGYVGFTPANYYTKWATTPPAYLHCGSDGVCSTIEYKSQTRRHVARQGYTIVANFGDQFSDLIGGYAEHPVKLPNPTYYLP